MKSVFKLHQLNCAMFFCLIRLGLIARNTKTCQSDLFDFIKLNTFSLKLVKRDGKLNKVWERESWEIKYIQF